MTLGWKFDVIYTVYVYCVYCVHCTLYSVRTYIVCTVHYTVYVYCVYCMHCTLYSVRILCILYALCTIQCILHVATVTGAVFSTSVSRLCWCCSNVH